MIDTCNVLTIIGATIHGAISPLRDDIADLQLCKINLPLLLGPLGLEAGLTPGLGELLLKLDVKARKINLVSSHICIFASRAPGPLQLRLCLGHLAGARCHRRRGREQLSRNDAGSP